MSKNKNTVSLLGIYKELINSNTYRQARLGGLLGNFKINNLLNQVIRSFALDFLNSIWVLYLQFRLQTHPSTTIINFNTCIF